MKHVDILELDDGFYYQTEDDWQGPFGNIELAQIALDAYLRWSQHDHEEIHKMRDYYE